MDKIIVAAIVLACVAYLLRKFVFKPKQARTGACGGCSGCGSRNNSCH